MINAVAFQAPNSPVTEAYRAIAAGVCGADTNGALKTIMITSVAPGSGKTTVAVNLAIVMAQMGGKVLFVDGNPFHPATQEIFGLKTQGLFDCIASGGELSSFRQTTAQSGLDFVPAGIAAPLAISPEVMRRMLGALEPGYDYILLDAASVFESASALSYASAADGIILVVASREDRPKDARLAKKRLAQTRTPILGCVLNRVYVDNDYHGYYRKQDGFNQ